MRTSSVLLYTLRGLAAEIAKNIVLAGVGTVTLLDDQDVSGEDLGANFFLREDDVGKKVRREERMRGGRELTRGQRVEAAALRIQALNPRVNVIARTEARLLEDEEFLKTFDLIVLTEADAPTLVRSGACWQSGKG